MRRIALLLLWITGLAVAVLVLTIAGTGGLAGPGLDPSSWPEWAREREPVDAAVAVLRSGLLLVSWYLLAMTALGVLARVTDLPRAVARLDVASGPLVRGVLSATLVVTTLAPSAAHAKPAPPSTAVMRQLDAPTTTTTAPLLIPAPPPPPPVATPPPTQLEWEVRPGDSFWRIARHHLTDQLQRQPTDREVAAYSRRLIAANEPRLLVRANPDLIHPGQRFVLP